MPARRFRTRPFQLVTGRVWKGTAFGGARGRTDVPRIVDWYMDGRINIDDLITHALPFEQINEGFELMRRGESIRTVVTYEPRRRRDPPPGVARVTHGRMAAARRHTAVHHCVRADIDGTSSKV